MIAEIQSVGGATPASHSLSAYVEQRMNWDLCWGLCYVDEGLEPSSGAKERRLPDDDLTVDHLPITQCCQQIVGMLRLLCNPVDYFRSSPLDCAQKLRRTASTRKSD